MSTAYFTSTLFARHRPAAASRRRALWRLMLMLRRDEQVRPRPPITLPEPRRADDTADADPPTNISGTAISPPPTLIPRVR